MYVSTSRLDSYRLMRQEEWFDWERFKAQLAEEYVPQEPALVGKDVHRFLEHRPLEPGDIVSKYGLTYDQKQVADVLNPCPHDTLVEVQGSIEVPTSYGEIFIPCRADGITGLFGRDWKTSAKDADPEKFFDSVQWMIYLMAFGLEAFTYEFFKVVKSRGKNKVISLERSEPMTFYGTADMRHRVHTLVEDYVCTLMRHGLRETMLTRPEKEKEKHGTANQA